MSGDPPLRRGWVAPDVAAELPDLALVATEVVTAGGRTPAAVRERLRMLSDRFTGARAVTLRQESVPWAYRVFFRQVGIDPDEHRTPIEQIAIERLMHGGFRSSGRVEDAVLIATLETGVPVVAFDADAVDGELGLRLTVAGERLGGDGRTVAGGQLAIADGSHALAVLFGDGAEAAAATGATRRVALAAVQVKGVPALAVQEALWDAAEVLGDG